MTTSFTRTQTYTVTDVRRVLAAFAADYAMIAHASGTHSDSVVASTTSDLVVFAEAGYLIAVDIVLRDAKGTTLRAAKYTISTTVPGWTSREPGNNLWPRLFGTRLTVVATLADAWWAMTDERRQRFRERVGLQGDWSLTDIDTSYAGMQRTVDRHYISNGYGMEKALYAS